MPAPSLFHLLLAGCWHRRKDTRSGTTAVEFALIGPVLLMLTIGAFEAGIQLLADMELSYGTRIAARFGVTGAAYPPSMAGNPPASREAAITALILQAGGGFLQSPNLNVQLASYPTMPPTGPGVPGAGLSANYVRYQATYTQPFATKLAASLFGQPSIQHQVVVWVVNEPFPP